MGGGVGKGIGELRLLLGADLADRFEGERLISTRSARLYVAFDRTLRRSVVVKAQAGAHTPVGTGASLEALCHAAVSEHPHILGLFDAGTSPEGVPYLVLEFAPGGSLRAASSAEPLPVDRVLRIGAELASALDFLHGAGIVHCDVKPSNVLLATDGTSRLADFGISTGGGETLGTFDHLRGSLRFVPPELLDGAPPAACNDVYALALSLWSVATGTLPFGAEDVAASTLMARIQSERVSFADTPLADGFGAEAVAVLDLALSKEPAMRPTAAEVQLALERAVAARRGADPPAFQLPVERGNKRKLPLVLKVAALVIALLAGMIVATAREPDKVAASEPLPPYCTLYQSTVDARGRLFEQIAAELEVSTSPTEVIDNLVHVYPTRFADIVHPWLERTSQLQHQASAALSKTELRDLALADALRTLSGVKSFIADGEHGAFDPTLLPGELREPARLASEATAAATRRCPRVKVDLAPAKARMSSSILSNLLNPGFMNQLFTDPAALDLFNARQASLLMSIARPFLDTMLTDHWDFLIRLFDRHPDIRAAASFDAPDLALTALAARPDMLSIAATPAWTDDLQRGLERMSPSVRAGVATSFATELKALGIVVPT